MPAEKISNIAMVFAHEKFTCEIKRSQADWGEAQTMPHNDNKNFKFSPRELKFLKLYFGGFLMKNAARGAGYCGSSDQALCNTGRAILNKYTKYASDKGIFRGAGACDGQIASSLVDMVVNNQSESRKVKYLTILSKTMFNWRWNFVAIKRFASASIHAFSQIPFMGLQREIHMSSTKKQQNGKPRGRPWPKGVSGNPCGRPKGSLNKITLAVLEGAKRAQEEISKPLLLDKSRHYECWSDCFIQDGMRFRKDNFTRVNPGGQIPTRPEHLDIREPRQVVTWKGERYLSWGSLDLSWHWLKKGSRYPLEEKKTEEIPWPNERSSQERRW
jgi:hypothetical protein